VKARRGWGDSKSGSPVTTNLLCAEIARLNIEREWHPLDTAPTDGTRILGTDGSNVEVIYNAEGKGWFNQSAEMSLWRTFPPTHWMPLPDPPKVAD
jgi:hypothetical protein